MAVSLLFLTQTQFNCSSTPVERVLAGEVVEEKGIEHKLVRLIQDIKVKVMRSEQIGQVVSADLNGNETLEEKLSTEYCKSPHAEVNIKARSCNASSVAGHHSGKKLSSD